MRDVGCGLRDARCRVQEQQRVLVNGKSPAACRNAVKDFARAKIRVLFYAVGIILRTPGSSRSGAPWVAM